ncbi:hypothetical protein [Xanthomarina sp.]|uniref:hypothetical protein n=1 Tax=Xanthomarina sp. TaxID=1931211 RepID=UPI002C2E2F39|nr:hypothetical protein [Xanthomarina sp.]HLV39967.1 hypothetical protein [Xanthomarina sp.]
MNNSKLIALYFSNKLSEDELLEFKDLYETNPEFKLEVDFLENVKSVSEKEDDAEFKKQLARFEAEFIKAEKSPVSKWLRPLISVAAVLLIALSLQIFYNRPLNEDKLFLNYFEPSKNVSAPIVRAEKDKTTTNQAFLAYSESNYNQAIPLFEKAFKDTENSELLFYEGNALLATDQTEKAIEKLEEHLTYSDVLTNRTYWYLALAYLKSKNLEKATLELKNLINSEEIFKRDEARSLLKKLE